MRRIPESDIVFRWVALLVLGFSGVFAFIMHAYFPAYAASMIGWKNSPFQFEVATADLAFGLLGILCFNASYGFRLATTVGTIIWLWGDAIGHIGQMILYNNFSLGNAGTWFWMDVTVPFILLICIIDLRRRQIVVVNTV